jgi:hypothetical protein
MDNLFGPLGKEYCIWFYFLSVLSFVGLFLYLASGIYRGISKKKDAMYFVGIAIISIWYIVGYFQNRLLYSMCAGK